MIKIRKYEISDSTNYDILNTSKSYWENEFISSDYDYKKLANKDSWVRFVEEVKSKNIKSVLDLGCGGGHWSVILARAGINRIKSVDFSRTTIDNLNDWIKEENLNIETEVKEIQNYTDVMEYDLIICNSVLDHLLLDDLKKVIKNISNMLSNDGYAYISFDGIDEDENEDKFVLLENGYKQYSNGMIWKYYNEEEIGDLLEKFFVTDKYIGSKNGRKYFWLQKKVEYNLSKRDKDEFDKRYFEYKKGIIQTYDYQIVHEQIKRQFKDNSLKG